MLSLIQNLFNMILQPTFNWLKSFFLAPVAIPVKMAQDETKSVKTNTGIFLLIAFLLLTWILYKLKIRVPNPFRRKYVRRITRRRRTSGAYSYRKNRYGRRRGRKTYRRR